MKRFAVVVCVALALLGTALTAVAERREVQEDNPFAPKTLDLYPLIQSARAKLGIQLIEIGVRNPMDMRYASFLWLLGFNTQALRQLYEALREFSPTSLKELTQISYFGSPRSLFKLLLIFRFPDEELLAQKGFFKVEQPEWWVYTPWAF